MHTAPTRVHLKPTPIGISCIVPRTLTFVDTQPSLNVGRQRRGTSPLVALMRCLVPTYPHEVGLAMIGE